MHLNNVTSPWLRRYAVFVACCAFGLLIAGGLVTSNDAALSVPDWPFSWGRLIPTLEGNIRYEFAHRVAAMLVALFTIALAVAATRASVVGQASACQSEQSSDASKSASLRFPLRSLRLCVESTFSKLSWTAVLVVLAQAALGGVAVRFITPPWATIAHAALGQLFFVLLVALCVGLYAGLPQISTIPLPALLCVVALSAQTLLGAGVRYGVIAPVAHIVGAIVATAIVMWCGLTILMRQMDQATLRRASMILLSVTFSQVFLGLGSLMARVVYADAPQPMPALVLFTVAHVAVGSLAVGAAVSLAMLARPAMFRVNGGMVTA
jgi:cytochrome c oxidase assembly protein subunit 15